MSFSPADDWVPSSCALPTVEQPLRRKEFDEFFAEDVIGVRQTSPLEVHLDLRADPAVAAGAADLATRETVCCSFFRFDLAMTDGKVVLVVTTDPPHETVLAALAARAIRLGVEPSHGSRPARGQQHRRAGRGSATGAEHRG